MIFQTMPQRLRFVSLMFRASRIKLRVHTEQAFIWGKRALFTVNFSQATLQLFRFRLNQMTVFLSSFQLFLYITNIDHSYRELHFLSTAGCRQNNHYGFFLYLEQFIFLTSTVFYAVITLPQP